MIKRFLAASFILTTSILLAQRNSSSPYSFFGIGQDFRPKTVENASMGGIGVAMTENKYLNFTNPAANANLRFSTYGLGGLSSFLTLKETKGSQSGSSTSLRYITLGFPIGEKAGFSAGIQPLSSVGYAFLSEVTNADGDLTSRSRYTGEGGTNRLYGSFGINAYEGLNLGIEVAFVFGNVTNSILNTRRDVSFATKNRKKLSIRGGQVKIGAQYKKVLENELQLSIATAVELQNTLNVSVNEKLYSLTFTNSGAEIPRDISYNQNSKGTFIQPIKTVLGLGIGKKEKWFAEIDYEFQDALDANNILINASNKSYKYDNSNRLSIGGYYIPKLNSISSYWNRITYRAGLRFEKTGLLVNSSKSTRANFTSIDDFGINVGLGLPLPKAISNLNLGFEYGQKGTTNNNLIKENYFNLRLSLSLNDLFWFKKRQID